MAAKAARGEWCSSIPPYGYVVGADHHLAFDEPIKVQTVRWLFEEYAAHGGSLSVLAAQLDARKVPPPRPGKPWTRGTVYEILTNERYTGTSLWNEKHKGKYHRVKGHAVVPSDYTRREGRRRSRGGKTLPVEVNVAEDVIIRPDAHPAIVSKELYQAVQKQLEARRLCRTPVQGGGPWALSGLLFCARCGAVMWGKVEWTSRKRGGGVRYRYTRYMCSTTSRVGVKRSPCGTRCIDQGDALASVVKLIQERLLAPKALDQLRKELARQASERSGDVETKRQQLRTSIDRLRQQITQGTHNLTKLPEDMLEGVVAEVRKLREELTQAERELANHEPGAGMEPDALEDVLALVKKLDRIAKEAPAGKVRAALAGLVKRVSVSFEPDEKGRQVPSEIEVEFTDTFTNLLGPAGPARRCAPCG
jgi:site-specific DNA recombinase